MKVSITRAREADAALIAALQTAAADHLTRQYGRGHWSSPVSEASVRHSVETGCVLLAWDGSALVGTVTLVAKKPWAIDLRYFSPVEKAVYLMGMAVAPEKQRRGIGRLLIREAIKVATSWPSSAIRLDAYDAAAGAGTFYTKCGFREIGRAIYRNTPLIYFEMLLKAD